MSILYMHCMSTSDPLALHRFARDSRIPDHPFDPDYVLHCITCELFCGSILKPFVLDPRQPGNAILAYSRYSLEALREQAGTFAPPDIYGLVDWDAWGEKALPETWRSGQRLGFRVRVCPLVRNPTGHGRNGEPKKERPEVDAFLASVWREAEIPSGREGIYRLWLGRELARNGAAEMDTAQMKKFQLRKCLRREKNRKVHTLIRPDALFEGTLTVRNGAAFQDLLARGIGRHRAFGFGMMLLRPIGGT
ncbi:MAG: type I-E CRISPR-associated protein Cas6/Cse3/CasE [Deltaproteobacteria bacterium]|nr:type I-E CRISPR-associated protein Cas6/Cse3/CasE [Deltaproteobacteria bacterium]